MISQPVSSIFPLALFSTARPLGLGELQACPFPDVVFPPLPHTRRRTSKLPKTKSRQFGTCWWEDDTRGRKEIRTKEQGSVGVGVGGCVGKLTSSTPNHHQQALIRMGGGESILHPSPRVPNPGTPAIWEVLWSLFWYGNNRINWPATPTHASFYLTHSFLSKKEEPPVSVACNTTITVKHILMECADLVEVRRRYLRSSLFRNLNPDLSERDWYVLWSMRCAEVNFLWRSILTVI